MEINIAKQGEETLVRLNGRLDTPAAIEVGPQLEAIGGDGTIVLDCSELSYISSSGLRIFLTIRKTSAQKGGKVIVRGLRPEIRSVFMMTGFLSLFQIED